MKVLIGVRHIFYRKLYTMVLKTVDRSSTQFIFEKNRVRQLTVLIGVTHKFFYGNLYNLVLKTVDRSPTQFYWPDLLVLHAEASLKNFMCSSMLHHHKTLSYFAPYLHSGLLGLDKSVFASPPWLPKDVRDCVNTLESLTFSSPETCLVF